eukprot:m.173672 g.173672  ORF g.173672 m.173672 type:complete len:2086 (+) comp13727_c0_seq1:249-6506(+)
MQRGQTVSRRMDEVVWGCIVLGCMLASPAPSTAQSLTTTGPAVTTTTTAVAAPDHAVYPVITAVDTSTLAVFASDTCGFLPTRACNATCPIHTLAQTDVHTQFSVVIEPRCTCGPTQPWYECGTARVNSAAHPAQYAFDNDTATTWEATRGVTNVTLALDFGAHTIMDIASVRYALPGRAPGAAALETSVDGTAWNVAARLATNCSNTTGSNVPCVVVPTTVPASLDFVAPVGQAAVLARFVRLRFIEFSAQATLQDRAHSVSDVAITARRHCNGHASSVDANGQCDCLHSTTGPACEMCLPLYNDQPWQPANATSANACRDCGCVGVADECTYNTTLATGQCQCLNNTAGRLCDTCLVGHFGDPTVGCSSCDCHPDGTLSAFLSTCSASVGQCACKPGVGGRQCDECPADAFGPRPTATDLASPCIPCNCSTFGSAEVGCDLTLGQCTCLNAYEGPQCRDCRPGYYEVAVSNSTDTQCLACHPLCATCTARGTDRSVCTLCAFAENATHCVSECPYGTYSDGLSRCQPCDAQCSGGCTAPGPSTTACDACRTVEYNGICVNECPSLHYASATGECLPCDDQCYGGCTGPTASNCTSCRHFDQSGVCVEECVAGFYSVDNTVDDGSGSADSYGSTQGNGLNFMALSQARLCLPCSTVCDECDGPGAGSCITCASNLTRISYYNPVTADSVLQCAATCPADGFYEDTETVGGGLEVRVCLACHRECLNGTCDGPSPRNCTACRNYNLDGECVRSCPAGTYGDRTTRECLPCSAGCTWCSGPRPEDCPVCATGLVARPGLGCAASCGPGEFNVSGVCRGCGTGCASCLNEHTCAQCAANFSLYQDMCVADGNCPRMTFSVNGRCDLCSYQCLDGCEGPTASDCLTCRFVNYNGTCTDRCPFNTFTEVATDGSIHCTACSEQCGAAGCRGPDSTDCIDCLSFAYNDDCVTDCPDTETFQRSDGVCVACHEQCMPGTGCTGPHPTDCNVCANVSLTANGATTCMTECPPGYYADGDVCRACAPECRDCTGPGTGIGGGGGCTECSTYTHNSTCVLTCPVRTYSVPNGSCVACDAECASACFGPGPSNCGQSNRVPTHQDCAHAIRGHTCVPACDAATEYTESTAVSTCLACHTECAAGCAGPNPSQCTECRNARLGRTCVAACPIGMVVADTTTGVCVDCHVECARNTSNAVVTASCDGTTSSDCSACAHFSRQGSCVAACDLQTEFVSSTRECTPCHPNCGTAGCRGPGSNECTTCRTWSLPNGDCVASCPPGHFSNPTTMRCEPCSDLCAVDSSCPTGVGPEDCTTCASFRSDLLCVATCPNNTYVLPSDNTTSTERDCRQCHPLCDSTRGCTGPTPLDCNHCAGLELIRPPTQAGANVSTVCVQYCPPGYYIAGAQCRACDPNCLQGCNGGSATNCTATARQPNASATDLGCRSSALISASGTVTCVADCGVGRYRNGVGICQTCDSSCGVAGCSGPLPSDCTPCASMQYLDQATGRCFPCSSLCAGGCSGPTAAECTSCAGVNVDGNCADSCDAFLGTHFSNTDAILGPVCTRCHPQCAPGSGCTGATDADCNACLAFSDQVSGRCMAACPARTYVNGTDCEACDASCGRGCTGPSVADCTDCRGVQLRNGTCSDRCPVNEALASDGRCFCSDASAYVDNTTGVCTLCHPQCAQGCSGPAADECLGGPRGCQSGVQDQQGNCVQQCPANEVVGVDGVCTCPLASAFPSTQGICQACNVECVAGCTGASNTECRSFPDGCAHAFVRSTQACLATCPPGFIAVPYANGIVECTCPTASYYDTSVSRCRLCSPECASCTRFGLAGCTACRGWTGSDGLCTAQCTNGTFANTNTRQCEPCDSECYGDCTRGTDPSECVPTNGRRCRHVYSPTDGCAATCGSSTPFVDVVGEERVCRASCPLGKAFHNDTRSVPEGGIEGSLCVASCSDLPGTVVNRFVADGPACSLPDVAAADAAAARVPEEESSAILPMEAIIGIAVGVVVLAIVAFVVCRNKSDSADLESPDDGPPPIRVPPHMSSIAFSPSYQTKGVSEFKMSPPSASNDIELSSPEQGYMNAYTTDNDGVMETPL